MNIETKEYNLPDLEPLMYNERSKQFYVWIPNKPYLILGRSNNAISSLNVDEVINDKVEVIKRPSGGETVILTPNTLVLSGLAIDGDLGSTHKYFRYFNGNIISTLEKLGVKNLGQKGISDITIGNKKILGSSIYKKGSKIFYHSVLNVCESVETIAKYISHPSKEPDYRKGRDHKSFVTSIADKGYNITVVELSEIFKQLNLTE
ncbi:MAG: hypothetical protein CR982_04845 [Candidatus Cloacimonadota bacterium]|nr:MAG: hypothetical protein CR982_04845 [Candidatus Cloacimonadota bacterium]PIE77446.1 MAG: hypothetical protein CSA15_12940 [Candidatus Delongbacteria bacterium]